MFILNYNLHSIMLNSLYITFYMHFHLITMVTPQMRHYSHSSDKEWSLERLNLLPKFSWLNFLPTFSLLINGSVETWIWYFDPKPSDFFFFILSCSGLFFLFLKFTDIFYNFLIFHD